MEDLHWHFIGPLQSNKSRLVAEHFDWCHTIDRLRIASRLSEQRPDNLPALNVLIKLISAMKTANQAFHWRNWMSWPLRWLHCRVCGFAD